MTKCPKNSIIIRNGERRKVLEELGELRFLSTLKSEGRHWETEMAVCVCEHTQELERQGWKVEEVKEEEDPTFTKEQVEAIKEVIMRQRIAEIDNKPCVPLEAWLDAHTEKE